MATIRELAQTAHEDHERNLAALRRHKQESFKRKASDKLKEVLLWQEAIPEIVWTERFIGGGQYWCTILEGIKIKAFKDDDTVGLAAYVATDEDGMAWCTFSYLAQLGALLAEDSRNPHSPQNDKLCDADGCFEPAHEGGQYCETHHLQMVSES